jgi:hypothetical protein
MSEAAILPADQPFRRVEDSSDDRFQGIGDRRLDMDVNADAAEYVPELANIHAEREVRTSSAYRLQDGCAAC